MDIPLKNKLDRLLYSLFELTIFIVVNFVILTVIISIVDIDSAHCANASYGLQHS